MGSKLSKNIDEHIPTAILLSDEKIEKIEKTYFDKTALLNACKNNLENVALEILNNYDGTNIGIYDKHGNTALLWACLNKLENIALKILEHPKECNITHKNNSGHDALKLAIIFDFENIALKILKEYDTKLNIKKIQTLIMYACVGKLESVVLELLKFPKYDIEKNYDVVIIWASQFGLENVILKIARKYPKKINDFMMIHV
jgi:ankyrin repeat protein